VPLVFSITALIVLSVAFFGLAATTFRDRELARARLRRAVSKDSGGGLVREDPGEEAGGAFRQLTKLIEMLATSQERAESGTYADIRQRLIEAGFRRPTALRYYMGGRLALSIGLAIATIPLAALSQSSFLAVSAVTVAAGLGFVGPGLFIDARRRSRQRVITGALPDAIDLMVVCVEAGLSLAATLNRVASEFARSSPALAAELKLTVLETQAGKSLAQALRSLGARNGVPDLTTFTSALIQTERLGTRVADTLRVQSDGLRTRRLQRAEQIAQRAPVKMLFPIVFFIFPSMLVILILPGVLGIISTLGQ